MSGKLVTVRMTGYFPESGEVHEVLERVRTWDWKGAESLPVRIEYMIGKGKVAHFPFGEVAFDRASADALLLTLERADAIICNTPREDRSKPKRLSDRIVKKAEKPVPVDPSEVRPSLRFLLEKNAKDEAYRLANRLDFMPAGHRGIAHNADGLEREFPLMARADEALGGKIRAMLRAAGGLPRQSESPFDKAPYSYVLGCIWQGNPHHLTQRYVNGRLRHGVLDVALEKLTEIHKRMEVEIAAEAEAKTRAEIEREKAGGRRLDPIEELVRIRKAGAIAVAMRRPVPADCPF